MRAAELSLETNTTTWRTLDAELRRGVAVWQRPLYEAAAEVQVSIREDPRPAVRLGSMLITMKSTSPHELQYGQTDCELRGIAFGLTTAGFTATSISVGDAPDSLVTLDSGQVWIEHADVIDEASAQYTNMLADLTRDVKDRIDADAAALAQAEGHQFQLQIGVSPSKRQVRDLRVAIVEMIRNGKHHAMPERTPVKLTDEPFKTLVTTMIRSTWTFKPSYLLGIRAPGAWFSPLSLAPIALSLLEAKRKKAAKYNVAPLWLVLSVIDIRGVWDDSMVLLGSRCPTIAPYERVIVSDLGRAVVWANGITTIRDSRPRS